MGFKVTEVQPTPNPNAMKLVLDRRITEQPASFFNAGQAVGHPLAERLFKISGVSSLLLLGDFVTVNKRPEASWTSIAARVKQALSEA
ncbi:MAG TPA: NifU N-terminal domain-containing protein [Tepidisphaeraceae bacterium]|nr:NifU N-terminal domain-containing protein [Tepidisphaeraceae bacterium]